MFVSILVFNTKHKFDLYGWSHWTFYYLHVGIYLSCYCCPFHTKVLLLLYCRWHVKVLAYPPRSTSCNITKYVSFRGETRFLWKDGCPSKFQNYFLRSRKTPTMKIFQRVSESSVFDIVGCEKIVIPPWDPQLFSAHKIPCPCWQ